METLSTQTERSRQILDAIEVLFNNDVMSRSGHANLSARLDEQRIVMTAGGTVRNLTPEQFAVVTLDGQVEQGKLDPTNMEIVRMHTEVYRVRPDVQAVIHTHSPHVTAFALANEPLPARYEALLRFGQAENIPIVPWAPRGSDASVRGIVDILSHSTTTQAVLLGNHGLLAFGSSPVAVAAFITIMEEAAEMELEAQSLGGAKDLPADALEAIRNSMERVR